MASRIEFRLSMPARGNAVSSSWGEGRNYVRVRTISGSAARALLGGIGVNHRSFHHFWPDGWTARVDARLMGHGERTPKSDGFAGYDWMIDNIIAYGTTSVPDKTEQQ